MMKERLVFWFVVVGAITWYGCLLWRATLRCDSDVVPAAQCCDAITRDTDAWRYCRAVTLDLRCECEFIVDQRDRELCRAAVKTR
jgi:hypothetical protein